MRHRLVAHHPSAVQQLQPALLHQRFQVVPVEFVLLLPPTRQERGFDEDESKREKRMRVFFFFFLKRSTIITEFSVTKMYLYFLWSPFSSSETTESKMYCTPKGACALLPYREKKKQKKNHTH